MELIMEINIKHYQVLLDHGKTFTMANVIKKIGKPVDKVELKISEPITRDSVLEIIPDGDLANNEVLKISYKSPNVQSYRFEDIDNYKITINEIYSKMKYDDVAPGDTITIEVNVNVYKGTEGTIGSQRDKTPNGKIEITLP